MKLSVDNLCFGWSDRPLLSDFSAVLGSGDMAVLRGDNGCGKTTFLKLLAGMIPHFSRGLLLSGDILIDGRSLMTLSPRHFFPLIAYFPSRDIDFYLLNTDMSEEIRLIEAVSAAEPQKIDARRKRFTAIFPETEGLWSAPFSSQSQAQKLLSLACIHYLQGAGLYLFDEPLQYISDDWIEQWKEFFDHLTAAGCIVILSAHDAERLPGIPVWRIEDGRLLR